MVAARWEGLVLCVAAVGGLACQRSWAAPPVSDVPAQPGIRSLLVDQSPPARAVYPAAPGRSAGGVDPTIGNPNPWASRIDADDYLDGFESYSPHLRLGSDWVPLAGQESIERILWESASYYYGVVDNAIAQTGANFNPTGAGESQHGAVGGPDPDGRRGRFLASPRGSMSPQIAQTSLGYVARVSHGRFVPTPDEPVVILFDIYLDDINTLAWIRPASYAEGFIVTSVYMGGWDRDGNWPTYVNADNFLNRLVVLAPDSDGGTEGVFFGAADGHTLAENEWFTVGIRLTTDSISVWVRDSATVGVYGFEQDSAYDAFLGDPQRGAFAGEIFQTDWLQFFPGVADDPVTARNEGNGPAFDVHGVSALSTIDSSGSPASKDRIAGSVDRIEIATGADPTQSEWPGFEPHDWYIDNYTVIGAPALLRTPPFRLPMVEDFEAYTVGELRSAPPDWVFDRLTTTLIDGEVNATPGGAHAITIKRTSAVSLTAQMRRATRALPAPHATVDQPLAVEMSLMPRDGLSSSAVALIDRGGSGLPLTWLYLGGVSSSGGPFDDRIYIETLNPGYDTAYPEYIPNHRNARWFPTRNQRRAPAALVNALGEPAVFSFEEWQRFRIEATPEGAQGAVLRIFLDGEELFPDPALAPSTTLRSAIRTADVAEIWIGDELGAGRLSIDDIVVDGSPGPRPTVAASESAVYRNQPAHTLPYVDDLGSYVHGVSAVGQGALPTLAGPGVAALGLRPSYVRYEIDAAVAQPGDSGWTVLVDEIIAGDIGAPIGATLFVLADAHGASSTRNLAPCVFLDPNEAPLGQAVLRRMQPGGAIESWDGVTPVAGRISSLLEPRFQGNPTESMLVRNEASARSGGELVVLRGDASAGVLPNEAAEAVIIRLPSATPTGCSQRGLLAFDLRIAGDEAGVAPRGTIAWDLRDGAGARIQTIVFNAAAEGPDQTAATIPLDAWVRVSAEITASGDWSVAVRPEGGAESVVGAGVHEGGAGLGDLIILTAQHDASHELREEIARLRAVEQRLVGVNADLAPEVPDGVVDGMDLSSLLADWGSMDGGADLNGDGVVDGGDLGLLLGSWGLCP